MSIRLLQLSWLAVATLGQNASPCTDGSTPTCTDGTEPTCSGGENPPCSSQEAPKCKDNSEPKCKDGSTPTQGGPQGGGSGPAPGEMGGPGGGAPTPSFTRESGQKESTACGSKTACTSDGGNHFVDVSGVTYDVAAGKFGGSMITNFCPPYAVQGSRAPQGSCTEQTLPDPSFNTGKAAGAPLLGIIALTLKGTNIYGPFEAGFGTGGQVPYPCADMDGDGDEDGYCMGGLDVGTCEGALKKVCGDKTQVGLFMDQCGGHASPYHHHTDMNCMYDKAAAGHSPLLAIALDGHGIYGMHETTGNAPTLDACGGHTGPVPQSDVVTAHKNGTAYHYHTTGVQPFTLGCYGPVSSLSECMALYSECDKQFTKIPTGTGAEFTVYNPWCPCYQHEGVKVDWAARAKAKSITAVSWGVAAINDGDAGKTCVGADGKMCDGSDPATTTTTTTAASTTTTTASPTTTSAPATTGTVHAVGVQIVGAVVVAMVM